MRDNTVFEKLDDLLMSDRTKYFTNREILSHLEGGKSLKYESLKGNDNWNALEGVYKKMRGILKKDYHSDFEFRNGHDRRDGFRYPEKLLNPMKQYRTAHLQMRTKMLERLFKQSVGLLPDTWLADMVSKGFTMDDGKVVSFDRNMLVENLQWVPTVFEAIEQHKVLSFCYKPRYEEDIIRAVLMHPYYLKEFNSRWFVLGYATYKGGKAPNPFICALDRVEGDITFDDNVTYIYPQNPEFAKDYFKDIVGVTKSGGVSKLKIIQIETLNAYTHGRIMTKKLHSTQQEERKYSNEMPGLITIKIIPNNELDTLLLSFGANIKVLDSEGYGEHFYRKVEKLKNLYFPDEKGSEGDKKGPINKPGDISGF